MSELSLHVFCAPGRVSVYGWDLMEPWVANGWQYATDGIILVRQPSQEPNTEGRKLPDAAKLFEDFPPCQEKWPRKFEFAAVCCPECHEHVRCVLPVEIAGRTISGFYAELVHDECQGEACYSVSGESPFAVAFSYGELQGLVCPIDKSDKPGTKFPVGADG